MDHAQHRIATRGDLLVTATRGSLSLYSTASHERLETVTLLNPFLTTLLIADAAHLVATDDLKNLLVFSLPHLELLSTRTLTKRPNAIVMANDGEIIVGDKFGDVYQYPLIAPPAPPAPEGKAKKVPGQPKVDGIVKQPILGHISMLTALILAPSPADPTQQLVVTGDRDEHVRVSRYPQGYIIDKFLFGNKRFVTSLLHLAPSAALPHHTILSAGGSTTLQVSNLETGDLVATVNLEGMFEHIVVAPIAPPAITTGKKLGARARKEARKGKGREQDVETVIDLDEEEPLDGEMEEMDVEVEPEQNAPVSVMTDEGLELVVPVTKVRRGLSSWMDGYIKGLAISHMMYLGEPETGGVVVVAAGATVLLYLPLTRLAASAPAATDILLQLHHPILDISPCTTDSSILWVSLDLARRAEGTETPAQMSSVVRVALKNGTLSVLETGPLETLIASHSVPVSDLLPATESNALYPALTLLINPTDDALGPDAIGIDSTLNNPSSASNQANKKEKNKRKTLMSSPSASPAPPTTTPGPMAEEAKGAKEPSHAGSYVMRASSVKSGKRAKGRATIEAKFAKAREAATESGEGTPDEAMQL